MIKKISSGIALTIRVLKNALLRPFRVIYSKINYMFSAGRVATAIPGAVKKLPKIAKRKPEKREDYFDWGSIYVAKSLVLLVAVLLVAIPLVYVFLLHPLFTSWWWVRDFRGNDAALSSYSGRVRIYYGEELDELRFEGRLKDGKYEEFGEEYWENGRNKYSGNYSEGQYSGSGILYLEDGTVLYRGEFADGKYNGSGELTENGGRFPGSSETECSRAAERSRRTAWCCSPGTSRTEFPRERARRTTPTARCTTAEDSAAESRTGKRLSTTPMER